MDHPVDLPLARPWRSAALVAAGIAALELVLLVVAAVFLFAQPFAGEVERVADENVVKAATPPKAEQRARAGAAQKNAPKKPPAVPNLSRSETSVLVLNGNGRRGAAGEAAGLVQALEYVVAGTGDAPRLDFSRSIVMYRDGFRGEAERLAADVRVKRVAPLDGMKKKQLQGAHVVLIVGSR